MDFPVVSPETSAVGFQAGSDERFVWVAEADLLDAAEEDRTIYEKVCPPSSDMSIRF